MEGFQALHTGLLEWIQPQSGQGAIASGWLVASSAGCYPRVCDRTLTGFCTCWAKQKRFRRYKCILIAVLLLANTRRGNLGSPVERAGQKAVRAAKGTGTTAVRLGLEAGTCLVYMWCVPSYS